MSTNRAVTRRIGPDRRRFQSASLHVAGLGLLGTSAGVALAAAVELGARGGQTGALALSALLVAGVGLASWWFTVPPAHLTAGRTFAAVAWTWIAVAVAAAIPYVLSGTLPYLDDALFESVSGLTTTGATVLEPIEGTSRGILFWRQLTQWYGGMGMIVLAVAVLPFLGVGGLDLISAEAPGPSSERLAPRVTETARRLWLIYVTLTVLIVLAFLVNGLSLYDATAHALTTVSTGGFSPYDDSIAHFDSVGVELVVTVGLLLGATSFILHWRAARGGPVAYLRSSELRTFFAVVIGATAFVVWLEAADGGAVSSAVREGWFSVVSVATTGGFGTEDFAAWVPGSQAVLFLLMVLGGMAGSTAGGVKALRLQVMARVATREVRRVRHPRAVLPISHDRHPVPEAVVARVAGFVLLFVTILVLGTVTMAALRADLTTAASTSASALGSIGPALGEAGPTSNYLVVTRPARGVLTVLMLLGRLELFPLLLMFHHPTRRVRDLAADRHR